MKLEGVINLLILKKIAQVWIALGIAFFLLAMPAYAENLNQSVKDMYEQPQVSTSDDKQVDTKAVENADATKNVGLTFWDFLRMIFTMIFVVALLYFVLRFIGKKTKSYQKASFIENIGGTSLGGNRSIQLVKVGERVLIVGVGENIQLLAEIKDDGERNELLDEYNQKIEQMIQPSDLLTKWKDRFMQPKTDQTSFTTKFKHELEQMKESRKQLVKKLDEKGRDDE